MHQTFYIDIDEEITSIVEKLRKTEAPEAVIVVPKRALLIQSIVNLKLLRKEADSLGLKISIVTQDKLGKMLIKKAGISISQKLEDSLGELELDTDNDRPKKEFKREIETTELDEDNHRSQRNLEKIGSADYFISNDDKDRFSENESGWEELEEIKEKESSPDANIDSGQRINVGSGILPSREEGLKKKNVPAMDVANPSRMPSRNSAQTNLDAPIRNTVSARNDMAISGGRSISGGPARLAVPRNESVRAGSGSYNETSELTRNSNPVGGYGQRRVGATIQDSADNRARLPYDKTTPNYEKGNNRRYEARQKESPRDEQLEKFFYANNFPQKGKENYADEKNAVTSRLGGRLMKAVVVLGAVVLVLGLAYIAYQYVPKAIVTVFAKKEVKSADIEISGDVNLDDINYEKSTIPAKLMEFDEEVSKTFNSTGGKSVSNQKAKGKITIYNEFSSSAQPLVATTRFLSDNQKMFRLVQGVTIPGTTKVGEEIKPGVVEAEIVADEAGDSFNIDATNFSIPGFKNSGNDKSTKIYAKSLSPMTGGGNGNDEIHVVSEKDVSDAKDKISLEITSMIKNKVKSSVSDMVILDDAIIIDEPVYRISNSAGETADSFEIKAQAHARALVFSESDVKKIANTVISKSGNGKINIDSGSILVDYGKSNADFKLSTIDIKMHASSVMQPNLDLENLKRGILGKNNDELADYLKGYPSIEKAEVEYFPQIFVSKIPLNEKRVEVILNATMP
ncbi:MAG: hypothetical protein WAV73_00295 [Candidatus Moraniibacteriota bacterium]